MFLDEALFVKCGKYDAPVPQRMRCCDVGWPPPPLSPPPQCAATDAKAAVSFISNVLLNESTMQPAVQLVFV
jgi:hypothetical protein